MLRKFLTIAIPLIAPTLLYFGWIYYARRRAAQSGNPGAEPQAPPWSWLISAGLASAAAAIFLTFFIVDDAPPGSVYVPPKVNESGEVTPGHFKPPE